MSVQEGDAAPDFEMPANNGRTVSKKSLRGKPFVLYFYPKADTPGCTKEACAFQEALPQLGDTDRLEGQQRGPGAGQLGVDLGGDLLGLLPGFRSFATHRLALFPVIEPPGPVV